MLWTFALRDSVVMTGTACANHFVMIDQNYRRPGTGGVAGTAIGCGVNVAIWYTDGGGIVVTVYTLAYDFGVINCDNWHPGSRRCVMAGITNITGRNMDLRFTCNNGVVMAIDTLSQYLGVIDGNRGNPGSEIMTGIALVRGGDMLRRLACYACAVMTGCTYSGYIFVRKNGR